MVNSPIFNIKFEHFPKCQPTWMIYHHEAHDPYFLKMVVVSVWFSMVTRLGLWLVKHGNKRNSKTNFHSTFKLGRVVHKNNSHKTMKPDFWRGCHGNQEAANQGILWHNLKFEKKIKKSSSRFCRYWSSAYVYQKSCKLDISFLSYVRSRNPSLRFSTFWDISKNISEI